MLTPSEYSDHLQQTLPTALNFLRELVSVNSYTRNIAGIDANANLIIKQFAPFGFQASRVPCTEPNTGQHLILDSGGDGQAVALIGHLDTVFSPETEVEHDFRWREDGDKIYGPGTIDIKGGTAMIWMVLEALSTLEPEWFASKRWIVVLNAAEEILSPDFGEMCLEFIPHNTKACLVFEPDNDKLPNFGVVDARKGRATFTINVAGRAAHAGVAHWNGANAIHQLCRIVDRISALTDYDHETTVNVGSISGGTLSNVVPDHATASLEIRAFQKVRTENVCQAIWAMSGEGDVHAASDGYPCTVEAIQSESTTPWPRNPGTDSLAEIWKSAGATSGNVLTAGSRGGLSDGNSLWEAIPTIDGLGPQGANAHCAQQSEDGTSEQEYVRPSSFVPKALINCLAIRELLA